MQKRVEEKFEELAKRFKVPVEIIKAIYDSQCMCTRENMKVGEKGKPETYLNIRWLNWGTYIAKPNRILIIHNNGNRNKM